MVCRENKGRSAVIGYQKHLLKQLGYRDYDDFELQSGIHEFGHEYEGFPRPSKEDQLTFLKGLKQQIETDPNISAADKYRQSDRQPGLVTRLDQEMARLKTGKDEQGRLLRPEQLQRGQDLAAMQRLGVLLKRNQEAKDKFFDVYARGMGVDAKTARARWKSLVRRQASERENTRISLTDSWRDNLAVAGFTSRQQADIGQSNVSREALRIMEEERRAKLASLPTRPSITSAQRVRVPERGGATTQCVGAGGCGQFGHERSACPNQTLVKQRDDARAQWKQLGAEITRHQERSNEAFRNGWAYEGPSEKLMTEMRQDRDAALRHDQQVTDALVGGQQGVIKCEQCAQFGHLKNECPNAQRVEELEDLRQQVNDRQKAMDERYARMDELEAQGSYDEEEFAKLRSEAGTEGAYRDHAINQFKDKRAEIAGAAIRCVGGCGQFGHAREECPNAALLDEVAAHAQEAEKIREQVRHRAALRGQNPDTAALTDADHAQYDAWYAKSVDIDQRLLDAGIDPNQVSTANALTSKPTGPSSARIQEVGYNPDTGYLEVTTRPYTRKRDGQVMAPKTYAYRMSPSQYQQMMAASSLTSYVSQSVWARNGANGNYQFENTAEAEEAAVQRKCATCGRWASMTSAHTCPVPGSRAGQDDSARRAQIKAEKKAARAAGRPVQMPPELVSMAPSASLRFDKNGGSMHYAHPNQVDNALAAGKVTGSQVRASFLDATVSGQVVAWNDADGQAKLSTNREDGAVIQCTCRSFKQDGTCRHVRLVGAAMASRYAADYPAVGSPLRTAPLPAPAPTREETAKDAPEEGFARMTYAQIRQRRAEMRGDERVRATESAKAKDGRWLRAAGAVDGRTGQRVKTPQAWSESGISPDPADATGTGSVRLTRSKDVQDGLRAGLRQETGKHWSVTRKPDGWLHITTALQRRTSDREITMPERVELAKALKMPVDRVSAHGVSVPPDNGWRAEFLDRAHGKTPRVFGERFVARADQRPEVMLDL
ncbi:hypothetical protein [Streptomyces sp. NPDC058268]|uniref:hypothetical protein n=1 Tax=Streptomyces sp. NPDC058268 TaxID=3346413 RepID=UPI0036E43EE9